MDKEHALTESLFTHLETSSCDVSFFPSPWPSLKGISLAVTGSLLVHAILAATVIFSHFIQRTPNTIAPCFTVSLVDGAAITGFPGGTEGIEGAGAVPHLAEPSPAVEQPKQTSETDLPESAPEPVPSRPARVKSAKSSIRHAAKSTPKTKSSPAVFQAASAPPAKPCQQNIQNDLQKGKNQSDKIAGAGEGTGNPAIGADPLETHSDRVGPHNLSAVDKAPEPLSKYAPVYPNKARRLGISGKVVIKFVVEADGRVSKPRILNANPEGLFEQSALEAILRWRFKPGFLRGKPVATWVILPFQFQLT